MSEENLEMASEALTAADPDSAKIKKAEDTAQLDFLKRKADTLGITYHPNIGMAKIKERLKEHLALEAAKEEDAKKDTTPVSAVSKVKSPQQLAREDATKLIRCIVTCMDPMKKNYEGEIFTSGNSVIGTVRKMIPFGKEYHVPQILFNMLKEKKYQTFSEIKDDKGRKIKRGQMLPAYALNILPDLTAKEIKAIADRQIIAANNQTAH